jgi:hypothetical protein
VIEPGLPLADLDAVQAYAQQQFAHYFGASAQRFAIAPWRWRWCGGGGRRVGAARAGPACCTTAAGAQVRRPPCARPGRLARLAAAAARRLGPSVWHARALTRDGRRRPARPGQVTGLAVAPRANLAGLGADAPLAVGSPAADLVPQPGPATLQPRLPAAQRPLAPAWPLAATGALVLATAA